MKISELPNPSKRKHRQATIKGKIAKIPLGGNSELFAIVDKEFAWLDRYNWSLSASGYARSKPVSDMRTLYLHRIVMETPDDLFTDHINMNKLDNRKANLRNVTGAENRRNITARNPKSGYKGVYASTPNRFFARITFNYKNMNLGSFGNAKEAAKAYNQAAKKYFGEFARLNDVR